MAHQTPSAFCPVFHRAVELIGRRWSGAVIRALLGGPRRYADLRHVIPALSDRMLSARLRELEAEGLVARTVVPETPVRVEYGLTPKGRGLKPVMEAISEWAEQWAEAKLEGRAAASSRTRANRSRRG